MFSFLSRIFHSYGDGIIAGEGLQILTQTWYISPLSSKGTTSTVMPVASVLKVTIVDPWHLHLLGFEGAQTGLRNYMQFCRDLDSIPDLLHASRMLLLSTAPPRLPPFLGWVYLNSVLFSKFSFYYYTGKNNSLKCGEYFAFLLHEMIKICCLRQSMPYTYHEQTRVEIFPVSGMLRILHTWWNPNNNVNIVT